MAEDIRQGLRVDGRRLQTKWLVQEIDFFMNKKQKIIEKTQELENELANIATSGKSSGEVGAIQAELNGLKISRGFFDRQISTAVYELKTRDNKRERRCFFLKPVDLQPADWTAMLEQEGLQNLTKQRQLNK